LLGSDIAEEVAATIGACYPELQGGDGLHEVILGKKISEFRAAALIDYGSVGGYSVRAYVFNGSHISD